MNNHRSENNQKGFIQFLLIPIVAAVVALFGTGLIALLIAAIAPTLGTLLIGLILIVGAYFIPDVEIFKGEKFRLGTKALIALFGLTFIVLSLLAINLSSFFGSLYYYTGSAVPASVLTDLTSSFQTMTGFNLLSLNTIFLVFGIIFIAGYFTTRRKKK